MERDALNETDLAFRRYLERPRRRRLARLVDAYYRFVWDTALRVTGNAADAADIAQDVFLKLLLNPPRSDQVASPRGFLAWEVIGRASGIRRAAERRKAREQSAVRRAGEEGLPAADLDELRARVRELPDELRTVVELRYFGGLKNAEIAGIAGVGERHVEKRLERARELLRSRIGRATALIALLDAAAQGATPLGSPLEPPPGLRADLLKIASHGTALAVLAAKAGTGASATANSKVGAAAVAVAAILILGGVATSVFAPPREEPGGRPPPAGWGRESPSRPALARVPAPEAEALPSVKNTEPTAAYASVRGTVWSEEGERIAGARVTLRGTITEEEAAALRQRGFPEAQSGPVEREVRSGETGEYSFAELYPVRVAIDVEYERYLANWLAHPRIKPGEETKCDMILCLPSRLHGTVRTPEGDPVKGALLFINFDYSKHYYADPGEPEPALDHAFSVDDDGRFDTGFGIVNIRHFCALPGYVLAPGREMKDFSISCRDFKEREARLDLVLAPERRIAVLVQEPSGTPVAGALVRASDIAIHRVLTNDAGCASLDRLPAEPFSIKIAKGGFQEESIDPSSIGGSEVCVVLHRLGSRIEGRITFDDAIPPANRDVDEVYFRELDGQDRPLRVIRGIRYDDDKGEFTYHAKSPLRFEALCVVGHRVLTRRPLAYDGRSSLRVDFHVSLEPPYILGRTVRADGRGPFAGVPIRLRISSWEGGTEPYWERCHLINGFAFPLRPYHSRTTSAADGSFLFLLSAPERRPHEAPVRTRAILTAGSEEHGFSSDLELDLDDRAATVVEDVELAVGRFGAVEGDVVDEAGQLLSSSGIVVAYDGLDVVKHAKAGPNGAYRIDGLRPGRYSIQFLGREPYAKEGGGFSEMDAEGLPRPSEFFERPVLAEAGVTSRWDIDLRKDALGTIDGIVPPDLKGARRAECALLIGGRPREGIVFGREDAVREGRFLFESLRPGTYRVWLSGETEGRISEAEVAVENGRRTRLEMPIPAGSLAIPVQGPPLQRISEARIVRLVRREDYLRREEPVTTDIAAARTSIAGGRIRLDGLPSGVMEATVLVPGFEARASEPVWVAQDRETVAPPLVLATGRSVRVRLDLAEGLKLPEEPRFTVIDRRTETQVIVAASREGEGPSWVLTGLPAGAFTIHVDAGSAFLRAGVDVNTEGSESEVNLRLDRRRD